MATLPMFPIEEGAPGDGNLIAVYAGGPPNVEVIGGLILYAQAIEVIPGGVPILPSPNGRKGEPLTNNGVTIWIEGSLLLDIRGEPTVTDYADMLSRWDTVRAKLLEANYELFVYYHPAAPTTYRKFKNVNSVYLRSFWNNPTCLSFLLAAISSDRTVYDTEPGM